MMDIFRILLSVGVVVLVWRIDIRGVRPVRDFVLWGVDYPFHFLLTATLILVIWGSLGAGFGLQGLFLDEDPLTQVLLGATVMLLFAAITVHYVALGTSQRGWWASLHRLATFLRNIRAFSDPDRPAHAVISNGFLEELTAADIDAIDCTARACLVALPPGQRTEDPPLASQLDGETFRLLVAPAVILKKGFVLILLVGVVPSIIIPLLHRDPAACMERLPWLIGVCIGNVLALVLGCWTTAWSVDAAGWKPMKETLLADIRRCAHPDERGQALGESLLTPTPRWVTLLLWFFVVHAAVTFLPADAVTSRWIDWPERTLDAGQGLQPVDWLSGFPWLPLAVLIGEAALSGVIVTLGSLAPRLLGTARIAGLTDRWRSLVSFSISIVPTILMMRGLRTAAMGTAVMLTVASVLTTLFATSEATRSVWLGLRGYASLGALLVCWLGVFWLATHAASGRGSRSRPEQLAAAITLFGLAIIHIVGAPALLVASLASAAVVVSGSRTLAAVWPGDAAAHRRPALAACLTLVALGSVAWGRATGDAALAAGMWMGLAALFLGSTAVIDIARKTPALLYPLTVLLGSSAFAMPYAVLDERWQSALPAAGSIACVAALITAGYTILSSGRPRSALLSTIAFLAMILLLNGAALFVAPNEFKGSFPNMASYYLLPVYLDSRDYFRDTTPSTSRLRRRDVTDDFDRLAKQGSSDRLATVYFRVRPLETRVDGGHSVVVEVEDPRCRLRAAPGDRIRLAAEEWFTIRLDGEDLVALAEEPFYRKIFPWFRYESVHMIRDGILRGKRHALVKEGEAQPPPRGDMPEPTHYRFITRVAPHSQLQGDVMGLRLIGLAPSYVAAEADYALITLEWIGHVAAVEHDSRCDLYTIEFELPPGSELLDPSQLHTMQSWMERCHLDTLRPAIPASRVGEVGIERLGLARAADGDGGDCVLLEDARTDSAVPVGVFLASGPPAAGEHAAFAPYRLTATAVARTIAATPSPQHAGSSALPPSERFTLRPAHDRGIFVSRGGLSSRGASEPTTTIDVELYNAARLRSGDRLILSWAGDGTGSDISLGQGDVYEIISLSETSPSDHRDGIPPGAVRSTLRPVNRGPGPPPDFARDRDLVVGQWEIVRLLNNTEVLQAWKTVVHHRWKEKKPKLVIVTLSGGGIRASVWTSVVLRKLEATLGADFPYHIRLITGASGGMVAGSYYATSLAPPPRQVLTGGRASFSDLHGITIADFVDRMATDQLDAVAGRMLFGDVPGSLAPFARSSDRGRTLERTWIRWTGGPASPLGRPLQSYAADERMGWRPSLVFTPMMVEDGRRLLISNLDLAFATRNVGGLLVEPSSRKIDRPTIQPGDFDLSIHEEDDVFSLSAVEFFRLFPEAHDFLVTTAIRMSASFPWVSPSINLPTLPPRRVVDAAYYDNYGVNLTALWLSKMHEWLRENTSGVLVVQVRDKVSQGARTEIDFDRLGADESVLDRLVWHGNSKVLRPGLEAITTPLIGVTNARQWTMAFRNDEQIDLQDLLFDRDEELHPEFFRTVVFECPVDVSLSWKLTDREKAILTGGFGRPDANPQEELSRVRDFMTGKDSYEFQKWRIDHRNDHTFQRDLKERYDEQLRKLGVAGTERLTGQESQNLYENVVKNLKRLAILADWWNDGHIDAIPSPRPEPQEELR